jgi:hypothetical protein
MKLRTCVLPSGEFAFGAHRPCYRVTNLREGADIQALGRLAQGGAVENGANFPEGDVSAQEADRVFEISNPFPFRGTTFILERWAERIALDPSAILLPEPPPVSLTRSLEDGGKEMADRVFNALPDPLKLSLATTSTDTEDLIHLADGCCEFIRDTDTGRPTGLVFETADNGGLRPVVHDRALYEVLANNRYLPDDYKDIMVLRPGAQGESEIVGEWRGEHPESHVFEYLRQNSYIPWGHYAANMAHDTVRYRVRDLRPSEAGGMRHLYYQRTYLRIADGLGLPLPARQRPLTVIELESLRERILERLTGPGGPPTLAFNGTLWGWNFGFDYAPTRYRLHASHQQIHQQYALVPSSVPSAGRGDDSGSLLAAYACGDLIDRFIRAYRDEAGKPFFETYIRAIRSNRRMDGADGRPSSLVVFEDDKVMVFVPKAQTSQWELQLMTLEPVGNILEADTPTRAAIDRAILVTMRVIESMGGRMVSCSEYSKRFDSIEADHRLLYTFLPRLPESPGAFSEAQLRWINGHYPEDFAAACRSRLGDALTGC